MEDEVPENYYLSKRRLDGLARSNEKNRKRGVGFKFKPKTPDEKTNAITTKEGGRKTSTFIRTGKGIRKLTPKEAWRAQGQPDWAYRRARSAGADGRTSDTKMYAQAGNSISVPVIGAVIKQIDKADIEAKEKKKR